MKGRNATTATAAGDDGEDRDVTGKNPRLGKKGPRALISRLKALSTSLREVKALLSTQPIHKDRSLGGLALAHDVVECLEVEMGEVAQILRSNRLALMQELRTLGGRDGQPQS